MQYGYGRTHLSQNLLENNFNKNMVNELVLIVLLQKRSSW